MADSTTGALIDGRYKVVSRLGAGGMADVFLAEDQQLRRNVALKLLHRRFAEDPGFVERFRREAQAAAGLQHPNVVSVYDRGAFDETYYIAMEYLSGKTLKQLIREEAPFDPVRAIDLTIQILKAARFAHRRGVIHRDLKPHNVIVDESDHAKVTDFGIARAGASDMTETGSIMGTAQYLSPEQAQGHSVSARSDLYSVGVILYELVTGRVPFEGEAAVTIAIKHVSETPPAPRAINPDIPPELEQAILWAMNKNPADRPVDAEQFIDVLEQVKAVIVARARGESTASFAVLAGAAGYANAGTGEHDVAAAAAAGALVGADAAEPPAEPPPEDEADRRRRWWWLAALLLVLAGGGLAGYLLTRPTAKVVPTVVNEQVSVAQTQVQNAGFTPNLIYRTDTHPSGTVIAQQPLGGTKADDGSTVTLTVSQGPGNTTVPSVSFLSRTAAARAIRQAQLKVSRVQSESSDTVPSNDATRTDPPAGTSLPVGSAVTLFVSSGQPSVNVPDVTGESEGAATANLKNAGFSVVSSTQTSTTATPGTVTGQNPVGGTAAPPHSTVTIIVAQASPKARVPDTTGQKEAAARRTLSAAGFTVTTQTKNVTNQAQAGVVLSQNPGGGSSADKGSSVTIVTGRVTSSTTTTSSTSTQTGPTTTSTSTSTR